MRPFELNIGQLDPENASYQVTWCISQELREQLHKQQVRFPHMLICVMRPFNNEEGEVCLRNYSRYLVPLKRGFHQIQINDPGSFRIFASVVWSAYDTDGQATTITRRIQIHRDLGNECMTKSRQPGKVYCNELLSWDLKTLNIPCVMHTEHFEVKELGVPDTCFAPEPWPITKSLLGLVWTKRPEDQCNWRRRKLLFLPCIPLVLLYVTLVTLAKCGLLLLGVLLGIRGMRPKALLHPKAWPILSVYSDVSDLSFCWKYDKNGKKLPIEVGILRLPGLWLTGLFLGAWFATTVTTEWLMLFLQGILYAAAFCAAMFGGIYVVYFLGKLLGALFPRAAIAFLSCFTAIEEWFEQRSKRKYEKMLAEDFEPLVCTQGGPRAGNFAALPESHRKRYSWLLWFFTTKTKVCKPFRSGG